LQFKGLISLGVGGVIYPVPANVVILLAKILIIRTVLFPVSAKIMF